VDEVLVDVVDDAVCVAHHGQLTPVTIELGLDEPANRQRERRCERELTENVDLMGCASALTSRVLPSMTSSSGSWLS
jgi:hypothetical protein